MRRNGPPLSRWKLFLFDGAVLLGLGIGALIGLINGAYLGGNGLVNVQILGLQGYESMGYVGGILGVLAAAVVLYWITEWMGYRGSSIAPELGFMLGLMVVSWPLPAFTIAAPNPTMELVIAGLLAFVGTWIGLKAIGLKLNQYGQHWRRKNA